MITCTKQYSDIPFAHRQHNHDGHCAMIHGHNWGFEFEFGSMERDENGFVIDFGKLKWLKQWLNDKFDHALVLNDSDPWLEDLIGFLDREDGTQFADITVLPDASCEGLALYLLEVVGSMVSEQTNGRVWVYRVTVYEDSKNSATAHS